MDRSLLGRTIVIAFSSVLLIASLMLMADASPAVWTVDDDLLDFPGANFTHIQDAVNAASPWDTILVYPGTYNERYSPPNWGSPSGSDVWAPAVIVYKDGLTVKAVDPDPTKTVIQSRHVWWSNKIAVQKSTNFNVNPADGTAPSAVIIIANHTTIDGFRIVRAHDPSGLTFNSMPVLVGDLFAGGSQFLNKVTNNTIKNCILGTQGYWFNTPPPTTYPAPNPYPVVLQGPANSWTGAYIWKSSNNTLVNNVAHDIVWRAIQAYDGSTDAQINWGSPSKGNQFIGNEVYNAWGGISVGAWVPGGSKLTDNSGTTINQNYLHDLTDYAVMFQYTNSSDVTISDNRMEDCSGGILCQPDQTLVSFPDMTIEGNTIKSMTYWGMRLFNLTEGMILRNLVDQCGTTSNQGAIFLGYCSGAELHCNNMTNSYKGLRVVDSIETFAPCNNIMSNTYGAENTNLDPAYSVNASNCYWKDSSGPYHATLNPTGGGNSVSDNILFDPWLTWYACATVGGEWITVNTLGLLAPWISLASATIAIVASLIYIGCRKKKQE